MLARSRSQGKYAGLYDYTHAPVSITAEDVNPLRPPKYRPLDLGPECVTASKTADSLQVIYRPLDNGDYIIQPKYMLDSGSMCVTELYSKALRVRLVHELLFRDNLERENPHLPSLVKGEPAETAGGAIKKRMRESKSVGTLQKSVTGMLKARSRMAEELAQQMVLKRLAEKAKKRAWKNRALIQYEKPHLCKHRNTDGAGTLLRNESLVKHQLKDTSYIRAKRVLERIKQRQQHVSKNRLMERFRRSVEMSTGYKNRSSILSTISTQYVCTRGASVGN